MKHQKIRSNHQKKSFCKNLLLPKTACYRLDEVAGELAVVPISPGEAYGAKYSEEQDHNIPDCDDGLCIDSSLPSYLPEQVKLVEQLVCGGGTVCLFQVDGHQMLCKARYDGLREYNLKQEIDCSQKISQASFLGKISVPKLLGYVKPPDLVPFLGCCGSGCPLKTT